MFTYNNCDPAVYVGTYHKYNCGSIFGKWMHLSDYDDFDAFRDACRELHKDEEDPEFMCQDYEGLPECKYCESGLEWLREFYELAEDYDDDKLDMIFTYWDEVDQSADPQDIVDSYFSEYMDDADFGEYCAEMNGLFARINVYCDRTAYERQIETLERYFDFETYGCHIKQEMHVTSKYIFDCI